MALRRGVGSWGRQGKAGTVQRSPLKWDLSRPNYTLKGKSQLRHPLFSREKVWGFSPQITQGNVMLLLSAPHLHGIKGKRPIVGSEDLGVVPRVPLRALGR